MKRSFSVTLKKIGNVTPFSNPEITYQVVAATAKIAIDKATVQFKKDEVWAAATVVERLVHRGPAI